MSASVPGPNACSHRASRRARAAVGSTWLQRAQPLDRDPPVLARGPAAARAVPHDLPLRREQEQDAARRPDLGLPPGADPQPEPLGEERMVACQLPRRGLPSRREGGERSGRRRVDPGGRVVGHAALRDELLELPSLVRGDRRATPRRRRPEPARAARRTTCGASRASERASAPRRARARAGVASNLFVRARVERKTVAGSLECRTTTERTAPTTSPACAAGARRCRRASLALRSSTSMRRMARFYRATL